MENNDIPNHDAKTPLFPPLCGWGLNVEDKVYRTIVANRVQYWEIGGKCEPGEVVEKALDDANKIYTAAMLQSGRRPDELKELKSEIREAQWQNEKMSKRMGKQLTVSICGEIIILIGLLLILML